MASSTQRQAYSIGSYGVPTTPGVWCLIRMADKPNKPCNRCHKNLTREKYCETCKPIIEAQEQAKAKQYAESRGTTAQRGYDAKWQKVRIQVKANGMWVCQCDRCKELGRVKAVTMSDPVHHIKPIDQYPELRLEPSNLVSMTRRCHEILHGRKNG